MDRYASEQCHSHLASSRSHESLSPLSNELVKVAPSMGLWGSGHRCPSVSADGLQSPGTRQTNKRGDELLVGHASPQELESFRPLFQTNPKSSQGSSWQECARALARPSGSFRDAVEERSIVDSRKGLAKFHRSEARGDGGKAKQRDPREAFSRPNLVSSYDDTGNRLLGQIDSQRARISAAFANKSPASDNELSFSRHSGLSIASSRDRRKHPA